MKNDKIQQIYEQQILGLNEMEISDKKLKQLGQEMSRIAGEKVEVEKIRDTIYAFGSELATLRLFMKYTNKGKNNPRNKFDVGKSENLGKFFFVMELG